MSRLGDGPFRVRERETVLELNRVRSAVVLATLAVSIVSGCECSSPDGASLTITAPSNGASLSIADDTDPGTDGLQISVVATSENLSAGTTVDLMVDGTVAGTTTVEASGGVTWDGVTLANGTHTLVGATREGGIRSDEVVVVVDDMCFSVSFVEPLPTGDAVRLTSADDTDGEPCGATFETTVVVATSAPNGSQAQLFVNSTPRASTTVTAGVARFEGIALDNRGASTPNTMRVSVTDAAGLACGADFPVPVFVQCEGPSCSITAPDTASAFLSSNDDTSAADGFQTDFEVTTDTAVEGRLIIDGDTAGAMAGAFSGSTVTFGNVTLTEATHRVVAECTDDVGNTTRSGVAEWTVDITECGVAIDEPTEGQVFAPADDLDPTAMGVQVAVSGSAGADCTGLRVSPCGAIDAATFGAAGTSWSSQATLATSTMQELCAQTRDAAGNVSEARVGVRFLSDAPQLAIATPTSGTRFNQATDLTPGDNTCAQAVEVHCDAVGATVELYRVDTATLIAGAPCVADATVPAPYTGRASFPSLILPNREDGMSFPVEARVVVGPLMGSSAPISIASDCNAPGLAVLRPVCGTVLSPVTQDEDLTMAGFQYSTRVSNDDPADVTLTIRPSGGGAPVYMATTPTSMLAAVFPTASYGAGGVLDVVGTATDSAGNTGTSPACTVTVMDLPSVVITTPTMGQAHSVADDCNAGRAGVQVRVRGTTDAPAGSAVRVQVGSEVTMGTVAGGAFNVCADADEGASVTITVEITDGRGTGRGIVVVAIDSMPPVIPIAPVTATVLDRRDGIVRFEWTAVADADAPTSPLAAYQLRCARTAITSEAEWMAARTIPLAATPGTPGTVQREDVDGFRPGEELFCALRGVDAGGALTPLAANATVSIAFMTQTVEATGTSGFGTLPRAVGDVNGDTVDDVITGGTGAAYLWYGSVAGLPATPSVTITSSASGFGGSVVGLGDVNGDGRNDFAVGAPFAASNAGRVYLFFGRPTATPFPASCNTDLPSCPADVVLDRPAGLAAFGIALSSSDFDGDGVNDIVISAVAVGSFAGEVYVVRGGAHLTSGSTFVVERGNPMAPPGFLLRPPSGVAGFGNDVAGLGGSVVGDARHDLVIGATGSTASPPANLVLVTGQAYAGPGLDLVASSAMQVVATASRGRFAIVASAGDVNGDGILDVASYLPVNGSAGQVEVYLGTATGFSAAQSFSLRNNTAMDPGLDGFGVYLGVARHPFLGNLGDLDRDMHADLLLGSDEVGMAPHGAAHLFYGSDTLTDRTRSEATPTLAGADGPRHVGYVGDVDGDGFNDFAIGEPAANGGAGRLIIVY